MKVCLVTAPTATDFEDAGDASRPQVRRAATEPHLGVLSLASVLNEGNATPTVVDLNRAYFEYLADGGSSGPTRFAEWAARAIVSSGADVFGFSSICSSYPLTIRIAERVKRETPGCSILFGGPQASAVDLLTLEAFSFVDFVLRGEAERTLPLFLDELSGKRRFSTVPGLTFRSPAGPSRNGNAPIIEDLDALPLPAYSLAGAIEGAASLPLELGRGCPFACTFCSTNDFFQRRFRAKSPERMLADMRAIAAGFGIRSFRLVHDMFTADRRRVVAFCDHLLESGEKFTWSCSARTDCVDEPLLELMARAGCSGIFFGVETGSRRMQKIIAKNLDPDRAKRMIEATERLGMATTVALITGFPEENWDDLRETTGLYMHSLRQPHTTPQLNVLAPLAGTPLYARYKDRLVLEDLCSSMSHQGRTQNDADRALIRRYPEIFPNFYLLPTRAPDHACRLELREFLLMGRARLRWLLAALHQSSGGILDVFLAWRDHRVKSQPTLGGGSLRHYYMRDDFGKDFVGFARERLADFGSPAVEALVSYHLAFAEAEAGDATLPRNGKPLSGSRISTGIPVRTPHLHVIELEWDIQSVIDALKRGERPSGARQRKLYRTDAFTEESSRLVEISPLVAQALRACNGQNTVKDFIRELSGCFSGPNQLRRYAAESLLEGIHGEGFIEIYGAESLAGSSPRDAGPRGALERSKALPLREAGTAASGEVAVEAANAAQ
jgi:radical SAM superfamily enzyme YgiQ (UPF0313 family)